MTQDQFQRLVTHTQALASLESELREDRGAADGADKALIRRVAGNLERARSELEKAIGASAVYQMPAQKL